ncbi:MFS family permease [Pigmentiphaga litoralis]|uniref:MFS family permease n=1 Tax=Pigmentiphaga litoralis TaxID=516702 RepID=A0A7Y9IQM6_9BURK|nr:MFS family permease [Pigmentiphaga litoralis]NYE81141.1 MFS family permease [Pigmentiphaga litoralis]
MSMLLASLGSSIANVGLPAFAQAFGAPFGQAQWIVLAYLLSTTTLVVVAGRLGDQFGRRRVLVAGVTLFTAASGLCALAPSLSMLIIARALQGAGAAAMMALTLAFVGDLMPKASAGRAMGLLGAMSATGTALGPALGGLLLSVWGWPALFAVMLPPGALAAWITWKHLPASASALAPASAPTPTPTPAPASAFASAPVSVRSPSSAPASTPSLVPTPNASPPRVARASSAAARLDAQGMLLLVLTLAAYALAMTLGRTSGSAWTMPLLLATAAIGAIGFIRAEARAAFPLIRLDVLQRPDVGSGFAFSAAVSTVAMATLVVSPFYLSAGLGLRPAQVGLVMSVGPIVAALLGAPAGRWVDRHGQAAMTRSGLIVMLAGCVLLAAIPVSFGVAGYLFALVPLTAGYAVFQTANNTAVMAAAGPNERGVIGGALGLSRNLGLISGASLMGAIFLAGAATTDPTSASPAAVAAGLRLTFLVAAALVGACLVTGQVMRRSRQRS